jgi:hypothetical protein
MVAADGSRKNRGRLKRSAACVAYHSWKVQARSGFGKYQCSACGVVVLPWLNVRARKRAGSTHWGMKRERFSGRTCHRGSGVTVCSTGEILGARGMVWHFWLKRAALAWPFPDSQAWQEIEGEQATLRGNVVYSPRDHVRVAPAPTAVAGASPTRSAYRSAFTRDEGAALLLYSALKPQQTTSGWWRRVCHLWRLYVSPTHVVEEGW